MKNVLKVNLGNFLLSLSDAMDLASPLLAQHQQRVAFTSLEIGKQFGLSDDALEKTYIAALLHDVGALSIEEKLSIHGRFENNNNEPHCILGGALLREVPRLERSAGIVRYHHRSWLQWGEKRNEKNEFFDIISSQIVYLADYVERVLDRNTFVLHQAERIVADVVSRAGEHFHPDLVECFTATSRREEFWLDLISPRLYSILLHCGPHSHMSVDMDTIASLSTLFKNIIDFRSRFTATHSSGVAACAEMLARLFGFTENEVQLVKVAGDLHDLGKLAMPAELLNKPASLTKDEFQIIKSHTYFTYSVLNSISGFEQIARWAAFHHEKLDGSGYPFHCGPSDLDTGSRIMMVADMFTALAEDRPYRKGMDKEECLKVIRGFGERDLLDMSIIKLLMENLEEIYRYVAEKQAEAMAFYQACRAV